MDVQDIVQNTDVQYVYDKEGKKTAVIIPIDAWMEISSLVEKLEKMDSSDCCAHIRSVVMRSLSYSFLVIPSALVVEC
jgi:hypothetical protein